MDDLSNRDPGARVWILFRTSLNPEGILPYPPGVVVEYPTNGVESPRLSVPTSEQAGHTSNSVESRSEIFLVSSSVCSQFVHVKS